GICAMVGAELKTLRPGDGKPFYDAIDVVYSQSTLMVVTRDDAPPPEQHGNIGGFRCPRCEYTGVVGSHRTVGTQTIDELTCPNCGLAEVADSDQPTSVA